MENYVYGIWILMLYWFFPLEEIFLDNKLCECLCKLYHLNADDIVQTYNKWLKKTTPKHISGFCRLKDKIFSSLDSLSMKIVHDSNIIYDCLVQGIPKLKSLTNKFYKPKNATKVGNVT